MARDDIDLLRTPFTVIWEVTRACDLACRYCRADASRWRHPLELTRSEGFDLLDQISDLGSPVVVMTGGDPLKRPDLFELIEHAGRLGLPLAVTPSGTSLLTPEAIARMRDLGVHRIALSLDGPTAEFHDRFRKQPGSYDWTVAAARHAADCGLPVQINTTVTRQNRACLEEIARSVGELGATMWSAFFLVTVGRAKIDDQLQAHEFEEVFALLYDVAARARFAVRTAAAPHYRRFVLQQRARDREAGSSIGPGGIAGMVGPRSRGVTDGVGLVFVAHNGDVLPSGFLPLVGGSIRRRTLADIYRDSPVFDLLHDSTRLEGRCSRCEFQKVCGGSRARAYAVTGNCMAEEPACVYEPRAGC